MCIPHYDIVSGNPDILVSCNCSARVGGTTLHIPGVGGPGDHPGEDPLGHHQGGQEDEEEREGEGK